MAIWPDGGRRFGPGLDTTEEAEIWGGFKSVMGKFKADKVYEAVRLRQWWNVGVLAELGLHPRESQDKPRTGCLGAFRDVPTKDSKRRTWVRMAKGGRIGSTEKE